VGKSSENYPKCKGQIVRRKKTTYDCPVEMRNKQGSQSLVRGDRRSRGILFKKGGIMKGGGEIETQALKKSGFRLKVSKILGRSTQQRRRAKIQGERKLQDAKENRELIGEEAGHKNGLGEKSARGNKKKITSKNGKKIGAKIGLRLFWG